MTHCGVAHPGVASTTAKKNVLCHTKVADALGCVAELEKTEEGERESPAVSQRKALLKGTAATWCADDRQRK